MQKENAEVAALKNIIKETRKERDKREGRSKVNQ